MARGDERREIVGGALFESPFPDARAQELAGKVHAVLSRFAAVSGLGTVYGPSVTVRLTAHDVVQPSLVFVRHSRGDLLRGGVIDGLPDLIVEVKTDSMSDHALGAKTDRYQDLGLPEFWLVYDSTFGQRGFHAQGWEFGQWILFAMDPVIRSKALPGLELHVGEIFDDRR